MSGIQLVYFDTRGRAEVIRLLLVAAGKKFNDKRVTKEEWMAEKANAKFNVLPNLVYNGKKYGQTKALVQFLAREFGMYGKDNEAALRVDQAAELLDEIRTALMQALFEKDEERKKQLTTAAKELIPRNLQYLEEEAVANGKNGYFVENKLTFADLLLFDTWGYFAQIYPEADTSGSFPEMKKILHNVESTPSLKSYLATRK